MVHIDQVIGTTSAKWISSYENVTKCIHVQGINFDITDNTMRKTINGKRRNFRLIYYCLYIAHKMYDDMKIVHNFGFESRKHSLFSPNLSPFAYYVVLHVKIKLKFQNHSFSKEVIDYMMWCGGLVFRSR